MGIHGSSVRLSSDGFQGIFMITNWQLIAGIAVFVVVSLQAVTLMWISKLRAEAAERHERVLDKVIQVRDSIVDALEPDPPGEDHSL